MKTKPNIQDEKSLTSATELRQAKADLAASELRYQRLFESARDGINTVYRVHNKKVIQCNIRNITKRKRTVEALHASEAQLQAVLESTADGILAVDNTGKTIKANSRFAELWRIPQSLLESRDDKALLAFVLDQLVQPEKFLEKVQSLYASDVLDMDTTVFKDGRIFERYSVPLLMAGRVSGRVWSFRDISAHKRESEEASRMVTVVRDSNDAITIQDFEGRITAWNRGAELMYGYSAAEALEMNIERLTAPGKVDEQKDFVRRLLVGEAITSLETRRVTKDGRILDVWMTVTKLVDTAGKPIGIASTERDTTALKQEAEEASRMVTVVRDSNDAITIQDFKGRITAWNHGAELMYGYSEAEALGMSIERLTAPGKVKEQKDFIRRLVAGENITSFETQRVTEDGRVIDVWMTVTKLMDKTGKPVGLASTERDITGRKRKEEEASRMATVVRDSNDAITIQDFAGRITAWNRGAELMYGYSEAEALEMNIERLTAPGKVDEQKDFVRRLIAGEAVTSLETQRLTKDGRILDVWMTVTKLVDRTGIPIGIASTERDTTALKREAEEASRMVTVVRDSNDAITIQDFAGRITAWNRGAELMYGYSEAEALEMNIERLTAPGKVDEQKDFVRRLIAGEAVTSLETQRLTKDGRILDVWMTVTKLVDRTGIPIGIASTERDTTALKREAEEASRMVTVVRDSNDAITIQDFAGRITAWNRGAELMYGYSEAEALEMNIERLTASGKVDEQKDFVRRLLAGEAVTSLETRRVTIDGRILDVWMTVTKLVNKAGIPIGIASTERDITKRKRAEEQVKQAQEELRKLNAELEQRISARTAELEAVNHELEAFSYSVSHDLKAPLRSVDGFAKMLEEDYAARLDDEGRRLLKVIRDSARDMGQLINDLLTFSRLSRKELTVSRLDLSRMVEDARRQVELGVEGRTIRWEIGDLPSANGDEATIREVLLNLFANAVKFTRPRQQAIIGFAGRVEAGEVIYTVTDNGVGFDMIYRDKLFCVFQRLHTAEEFEGTGIGLALVKRIIQRHGGRVWVEGEVNKGARIYFTLSRDGGEND